MHLESDYVRRDEYNICCDSKKSEVIKKKEDE